MDFNQMSLSVGVRHAGTCAMPVLYAKGGRLLKKTPVQSRKRKRRQERGGSERIENEKNTKFIQVAGVHRDR